MRRAPTGLAAEVDLSPEILLDLQRVAPSRRPSKGQSSSPSATAFLGSRTTVAATDYLGASCLFDGIDDDAVWLITGASSGIGRVAAEAALEKGQRVVATAGHIGDLEPLIDSFGSAVFPIELDVNDESADRDSVARSLELFGRLDIVVNNAGFDDPSFDPASDRALERVRTNLFGSLWISQSVLGFMEGRTGGQIVLVFAALRDESRVDDRAFDGGMRAFSGFAEHLANEVAPFGIKITVCVPADHFGDWLIANDLRLCEICPFEVQ